MTTFKDLGLSDTLVETLDGMGFETPTEIQEQAIPTLVENPRDFIGLAQTGTGKTAAFGLPLLHHIDLGSNNIQALILAPTRELSNQIAEQLKQFSAGMKGLRTQVVYGGTSIIPQIKDLHKNPPHILVATPGRLIDLTKRKAVKLNNLDFIVLDEADEMLNMGFREDLDTILSFTPKEKVTWLFSATMPKEIRRISKSYMADPLVVQVSSGALEVNKDIEHQYTVLRSSDKSEALRRFMDVNPDLLGVVFCRTKIDTQRLADDLITKGYSVEALHGDMSQQQRDLVMRRFKKGHLKALIATDVAARGIDVSELSHVIHHTIPDAPEYYTHRSGRTARAGNKGISLAFVTRNDQRKLSYIGDKLNIKFAKVEVPALAEVFGHKVENLAKTFNETKISDVLTPELLDKVEAELGDIDKRGIIAKWLSFEMDKNKYGKDTRDLNDKSKSKSDRGERTERGERDNSNFHRFFINMGRTDELEKGDLLRMVCDVTEVEGANVGAIRMYDKHSTFDVDKRFSEAVVPKFKDILVNGREIRVNRDDTKSDDRPRKRSGGSGGRSSFKGKSGGGNFAKRRVRR